LPVALARALRDEGVAVPVDATVTFARALDALADGGPVGAYWAGRATLVRRPEDVPAYDRAFFGLAASVLAPAPTVALVLDADDAGAGADDGPPSDPGDAQAVRWSPVEVLRAKDLGACSDEERDEALRLLADLRTAVPQRRSRRRRPDRRPRHAGLVDLRRTTAAAVRAGGEVGRPSTTSPTSRPRRVVLLLDVSGSMAPYAHALARYAHASVAARRRGHVEVFAVGTRLTRITRELATHDPDAALARAAAAVVDWDGGTRLGDGLREFNDRWGVRGTARGAVVVILSDGWDRGDPDVLATEVARLRRVAHRLVWANPLAASPGYEPTARGMAAALPHVDALVPGHSVDALRAVLSS
jgi:uncharacterized protein with von Willebrand factor type A (vWA) domain